MHVTRDCPHPVEIWCTTFLCSALFWVQPHTHSVATNYDTDTACDKGDAWWLRNSIGVDSSPRSQQGKTRPAFRCWLHECADTEGRPVRWSATARLKKPTPDKCAKYVALVRALSKS